MPKFIFILIIGVFGFAAQQRPWDLVLNKEGIRVYTRKTDSVAVKEYKVTMQVRASMDSVLKKVLDIRNLKRWSYRIAESSLIKKVNDSTWLFYIHNDVEWPVKDRDHVSKVQLFRKRDEYTILLSPYNNFVREKKDVVRLTNFRGVWSLKKIDKNYTQVTQQLYGDPESNVPPFFINLLIAKAPFYTFKNMKTQLEAKEVKQ